MIAIAALGLITTANRIGAWSLRALAAPALLWLASLCLPSLLVCSLLYLSVRPAHPFGLPQRGAPWGRLVRLGGAWLGLWLAGSAVAALLVGHWSRYTSGLSALLCFVVIAPLQEELLYRGALFELAERGWPTARRWSPIVATTVPFALQHFQFHGYQFSSAALLQVAFTLPMGLVFGRLRQGSASIWPGVAVHALTNLSGAFGGGAP
jgi:membrane protease YdiL (CAAX protease family)